MIKVTYRKKDGRNVEVKCKYMVPSWNGRFILKNDLKCGKCEAIVDQSEIIIIENMEDIANV